MKTGNRPIRNGSGSAGPEVEDLLAGGLERDRQARARAADPGAGGDDQPIGDDRVGVGHDDRCAPSRSIRRTGVLSSTRVLRSAMAAGQLDLEATALAAASMPASGSKTTS